MSSLDSQQYDSIECPKFDCGELVRTPSRSEEYEISENKKFQKIEQNIVDWLDKNGIFWKTPGNQNANDVENSKISHLNLSSKLFLKRKNTATFRK